MTVAAVLALCSPQGFARRPPIPIEITGTILTFDRANQTLTIEADEPARVLQIAVGSDCRFKQRGAETGEQFLRRGARVKVSYFATIFTGNVAVKVEFIGDYAKNRR